jgi:hypothetical protein
MPLFVRAALAFLPLSAYFFALGIWQGGTRPRVVSGAKDFGMLSLGLGGLIAFGPLGQVAVDSLFPKPSLAAWMAVASFVGLVAMAWSLRARRRMVVYRVEAEPLDRALNSAMAATCGRVSRTVLGIEDVEGNRGITVDRGRFRVAVIEAHGDHPEALIAALGPVLARSLAEASAPPSRLPWLWFSLSSASAAIPTALALLTRPEVRAAIRRMGGG